MKKISSILTHLFIIIIISAIPVFSRSWDDLDRGEHKIYGSEKEEKYPVKTFFLEKEEWEDHYSLMVFGLYKNKDYPRYKSLRFLPFYYGLNSKIDNRKMTVIPPLLSYFERDGDNETLFLFTPLYYSNINKYGSDRSLFFLYWWGKDNYSYGSENYHFLFPLLYHESTERKNGYNESFCINPLFVSFSDENLKTGKGSYTWWAPIIPLTYHSVDSYGGHRNIFWLLDYSWETHDGKDSMQRFWLFPALLWGKGSDGYTYILPPLFIYNKYSNGEYYNHLLPLYARWTSKFDSTQSDWNINVLYGRNQVFSTKTGEEIKWKFWAPILPVFYWSTNSTGSSYIHTFPLFAKWKDIEKNYTDEGLISPLYCSTRRKSRTDDSTLYSNFWFPIIPLYYSSETKGIGNHKNLFLLFDWENDEKNNLKSFWFIPLVFHESRDYGYRYYLPFYIRPSGSTEKEGMHFSLFHYHSWSPEEEKTWAWLYYNRETNIYTEMKDNSGNKEIVSKEHYTHFLPLYWDWKSSSSEGTVVLPLYLNYRDSDTRLHINLTGYARKTYMGPFKPDLTVGLENKDNTWHLDTDLSWLYDVWSFSSRIPMKNPFNKDVAGENDKPENKEIQFSKISDENKFTRENSHFFWGWKLLFGWMAYERSDDHRHFRMLPLAWINLTDNSDDKFIAVLNYISYKSTELDEEYFTIIPFYGYQRKGESYKRGVLINLYWDEFDADKKYREQTVLWPFINWYDSPEADGYRVFPFVWHKSWLKDSDRHSRTISLLHYNRKINDEKSGDLIYSKQINLFYYKKEEKTDEMESYSLNIPLLPLFHYNSEIKKGSRETTTINPLFYRNSESDLKTDENSSLTFWAPIAPLFYYHESRDRYHMNVLGLYDRYKTENHSHTMVLPLYYSSENNIEEAEATPWKTKVNSVISDNTTITPINYSSTESYRTDEISVQSESSWYPVIPLYYNKIIEEKVSFSGTAETEALNVNYSARITANPFFYSSSSSTVINGEKTDSETLSIPILPIYYSHSEGDYRHWNLLGLIDHCEDRGYSRNFFLPFYYKTDTNGEEHRNILGLYDTERNSEGELTRSMLLPFYYWSGTEKTSSLTIFPLLSGHYKEPGSNTKLILGTYWHSSKKYERQNIYYLYDHKKYSYAGHDRNEFSLLFGTVDYEKDRELRKFRMFWGALCNYKTYTNSPDYEFNALIYLAGIEHEGKSFHHRILPLYSYSSYGDNEWSLLVPPVLSYFSESPEGDFDLGLLGLLYYRNENVKEGTDRRMWLLGTIYNEVKEPERGYHVRGSMWGGLWSYTTEDNGFRKFSILKGLYKWVERDGEKKHTILWIF